MSKRGVAAKLFLAASMVFLSACSVQRLEDVMGPAPATGTASPAPTPSNSLTQPPQDVVAFANPADAAAQEPDTVPLTPPADMPDVLSVQENRQIFTDKAPWRVLVSDGGVDAINADGTICSGRLAGNHQSLLAGARIPLACSDGNLAQLEVPRTGRDGTVGHVIINGIAQGVSMGGGTSTN
jgi:hypothetical protein